MDGFETYELPEEDDLALVYLERRYREELNSLIEDSESGNAIMAYQFEFMNKVLAAARALNIDYFSEFSIPANKTSTSSYERWQHFEYSLASYLEFSKIQNSRRKSAYTVRLSTSEKGDIQGYITKIRETLERSALEAPKKEAIFRKLNALSAELDRDRTKFEVFADFAGGLANVSADFAKRGAEPWWKWVRPIFEILGAAKESENQRLGLPKPDEQKRLEPPRPPKTPEEPAFESDLDDDVPF